MAQQLSEVEVLVEELETRVERLRALYEMYFMGIEKIEPSVARKDVDRRFYVLRRTQIRNTALRFRFLNVLLRYNTYQTYWMRITRKIEEGTYKRDVRRANARFADAPAGPKKANEKEIELDDVDLSELYDEEPASSLPGAAVAPSSGGTASQRGRRLDEVDAALSQRGQDLEDELSLASLGTDDPFAEAAWLEPQQVRAGLKPAPVPREARSAEEPRAARNPLEVMPTQREIWVKKPPSPPTGRPTSRPPRTRTSSPPKPPPMPRDVPAAAHGGVRYAQGPQGKRLSEVPVGPRAAPPRSAPASAAAPSTAPPGRRRSRPSMPKVEAGAAVQPARPRPAPVVSATARSPNPSARSPAAAQRPAHPAPKLSAAPASGLSEERVRQIYTQYVETKRSLKESTASLTYDNLAKSLRDSSDKLRSKHTGKSVDFEVAVKDGRTILRPVVK